jgi:hypothetical protein
MAGNDRPQREYLERLSSQDDDTPIERFFQLSEDEVRSLTPRARLLTKADLGSLARGEFVEAAERHPDLTISDLKSLSDLYYDRFDLEASMFPRVGNQCCSSCHTCVCAAVVSGIAIK